MGDNNPWSFGSKTKTKKKTTSSGFDFGSLDAAEETNELNFEGDLEDTKAADDAWGFAAVNKKDKKKKGPVEELEPEKQEEKADDGAGAWGTTAKDKKRKGKKGVIEEEPPPPPPPAPLPDPPAAEDEWSAFSFGKNDKKKGKKGTAIEVVPETEPALDLGEPTDTFGWGFSSKTDKKNKKALIDEVHDDPVVDVGADAAQAAVADDDWTNSAWGTTTKKKDKKGKKGFTLDEEPSPLPPAPEPPADEADNTWGAFTTKSDKKGKKNKITSPEQSIADMPAEPEPEPEIPPPLAWDFGLSTKDKKKKEKELRKAGKWDDIHGCPFPDEPEPEAAAEAEPEPELEPEPEIPPPPAWDFGLSVKDKKKKEKELRKAGKWDDINGGPILDVPEPEPEPVISLEAAEEDTSWGFGLSAKDKKNKEKDSKKKSSFDPEPEPEMKFDDPEPEKAEDTWGTWGVSTKDKKKDTKKKGAFDFEPEPEPERKVEEPEPEKEEKAEDTWGTWGVSKDDKKKETKKKGLVESVEEKPTKKAASADAETDIWGSWGAKDKKSVKKGKKEEPPPPVPTPPAQGLTPEPVPMDTGHLDDFGGDTWGGLTTSKSKTSSKKDTKATTKGKISKVADTGFGFDDFGEPAVPEEPPIEEASAKASKSIWGFGGTSTAKTKKEKDKETKAKKDEEERLAEEDRLAREAEEAEADRKAEEEAAKAAKKDKASKLTKTLGKTNDKTEDKKKKSDAATVFDIMDDPVPIPKTDKANSKLKKTVPKTSDDREEAKIEEKKADDYFGFWGSAATSKKTAGKKDIDTKKEIANKGWANEDKALGELDNDLEFPIDDDKPATSSKTSKAMTGKSKPGVSSVASRIKELEGKKEEIGKKSKVDTSLTKDPYALDEAPSPKEEKKDKASKTKSSTTTSKSKKKEEPVALQKKSKDSIPGGFPGAFGDDDDFAAKPTFDEPIPAPPQKSRTKTSKTDKTDKKTSKTKTTTSKETAMDGLDLLGEAPEPSKLPTPPPEDKKPAKKERARVERTGTGTAASWGFWGAAAAPKKPTKVKSKDDEDVSPPPSKKERSPPGLSRSKSTRTPREKEGEDRKEVEKSSGSDKDGRSKKSDRPGKTTRGTSFSNFMFGGPPPSAMRPKPARRSSTAGGSRSSSRQRSDGGLMSPPPEADLDMTGKAAKLMGVKSSKLDRSKSVKGKGKGMYPRSLIDSFNCGANHVGLAAPDPYPIDDDDMVMINAPEEPRLVNGTKDKSKTKSSKSKREVGYPFLYNPGQTSQPFSSQGFGKETHTDGKVLHKQVKSRSNTISHDDDVVMVDNPTPGGEPLITSGPDDLAFVDHPPQLKRSNTAKKAAGFFGSFFGGGGATATKATEDRRPRTATLTTDAEDHDLPIRTKSTSKRHSKLPDGDGFTTDAPAETDAGAEARRADRRAKRDARDQAEEAERAERERRRKERREREKADLEARRTKARDRARKEQEYEDQRREEKRARRAAKEVDRPHDDLEMSAEARERREERRRLREQLEAEAEGNGGTGKEDRKRSKRSDGERRKEKSGRSKATTLMEEYHESRSGSGKGVKPPANKTSSWIANQADEPPELPPVEGTVLDPSGERPRKIDDDDSKRRHKDKYAGMTEAEIEEHRAKRKNRRGVPEKSASGGSDERKKTSRRSTYDDYEEPVRTFDGRPALARGESKRNSFLGKFF